MHTIKQEESEKMICARCFLIRDVLHWVYRRKAKSTGNMYWSNPDLSPHYMKIGEDWVHCLERKHCDGFNKYGLGYSIMKEYKDINH